MSTGLIWSIMFWVVFIGVAAGCASMGMGLGEQITYGVTSAMGMLALVMVASVLFGEARG